MEYLLSNGKRVVIRKPDINDAEAIMKVISVADTETLFLARNPGEFCVSVEREKEKIAKVLSDECAEWFVAEYENKIVGQCSVSFVRRSQRYRHRAEVAFVVLKDYCGIGIGGKMMQTCIDWCKNKRVEQMELSVVTDNERAINMYESFGFETKGLIPKALKYQDGSYADEYLMILNLQDR